MNSNRVKVEITGWQGGTKEDTVNFVNKKSRVRLYGAHVSGNVLCADIDRNDSQTLRNLGGIRFAGGHLKFAVKDDAHSNNIGQRSQTIDILKSFLISRYDQNQKLLNLTAMKQDPTLAANGMFGSTSMESKFLKALMVVADQQRLEVESLMLNGNELTELMSLAPVVETFPRLKNLSLADNHLSHLEVLDAWKNKFLYLKELIMHGNAITVLPDYKMKVMKVFPKLTMLDGQVIRDENEVRFTKWPISQVQTFFENKEIANLAQDFLVAFFNYFDTDRSQLAALYDSQSLFSVSVDTIAPHVPSRKQAPLAHYFPSSRNLMRVTSTSTRNNRLCRGVQEIIKAFKNLPATSHDLKSAEKFSLQAWHTYNLREANDTAVVISVHGEFTEPEHNSSRRNNNTSGNVYTRSFDRTFILLPGPLLVSDMLFIRAWSGTSAWTSPFQKASKLLGGANGVGVPAELQGLSPDQLDIITKVIDATGLTAKYARILVEQANFNLDQASLLFGQSKASGSLPPDAFLQ